jgi:hypothetical protein
MKGGNLIGKDKRREPIWRKYKKANEEPGRTKAGDRSVKEEV